MSAKNENTKSSILVVFERKFTANEFQRLNNAYGKYHVKGISKSATSFRKKFDERGDFEPNVQRHTAQIYKLVQAIKDGNEQEGLVINKFLNNVEHMMESLNNDFDKLKKIYQNVMNKLLDSKT